jgi:hypothetical protein
LAAKTEYLADDTALGKGGYMDTSVAIALIGVIGTLITAVASIVVALIAREQHRQKHEIDVLWFLVSHFLPHWEREHLQKLARGEPFPYDKGRYLRFEDEVRQLKDRELIEPKKAGFKVGELPGRGDLQDFFKLSADGEKYFEILSQMKARSNDLRQTAV